MSDWIPDFLKHKKFQVAILTSFGLLLGQTLPGWAASGSLLTGLAGVNWTEVMAPLVVAIGAQGVADFGKERAKVDAEQQRLYAEQRQATLRDVEQRRG